MPFRHAEILRTSGSRGEIRTLTVRVLSAPPPAIGLRGYWYRGRDLNPHWTGSQPVASAVGLPRHVSRCRPLDFCCRRGLASTAEAGALSSRRPRFNVLRGRARVSSSYIERMVPSEGFEPSPHRVRTGRAAITPRRDGAGLENRTRTTTLPRSQATTTSAQHDRVLLQLFAAPPVPSAHRVPLADLPL